MFIEMLLAAFNTLLASIFVSLNSAAPQLRVMTYDTNEADRCIENNYNYITHVCTYPGQKDPCLHESFGTNG